MKILKNRPISTSIFMSLYVISFLTIVGGVMLFSNQVIQFIKLGVWVPVPASELFVGPPEKMVRVVQAFQEYQIKAPTTPQQVQQALDVDRQLMAYSNVYSDIPGWFESNDSWLSNPHQLYGLHVIIKGLLDFISLPIFSILVGFCIGAMALGFGVKRKVLE